MTTDAFVIKRVGTAGHEIRMTEGRRTEMKALEDREGTTVPNGSSGSVTTTNHPGEPRC